MPAKRSKQHKKHKYQRQGVEYDMSKRCEMRCPYCGAIRCTTHEEFDVMFNMVMQGLSAGYTCISCKQKIDFGMWLDKEVLEV